MSHVLPNISRGRFFEPNFTSKKFDLYTSIYGIAFGSDSWDFSSVSRALISQFLMLIGKTMPMSDV